MAFNYQLFQRWSMSFDIAPTTMWNYTSFIDSFATISASGFFNSVNVNPESPQVNINDLMWLVGSDVPHLCVVTAISPDITVSTLV